MTENNYVRRFHRLLENDVPATVVLKQVKDYRQRLDNIPSSIPGHDQAVAQANQLIAELDQQ